eukprot:5460099-Pleurochrysis_carterae.AAC.1
MFGCVHGMCSWAEISGKGKDVQAVKGPNLWQVAQNGSLEALRRGCKVSLAEIPNSLHQPVVSAARTLSLSMRVERAGQRGSMTGKGQEKTEKEVGVKGLQREDSAQRAEAAKAGKCGGKSRVCTRA